MEKLGHFEGGFGGGAKAPTKTPQNPALIVSQGPNSYFSFASQCKCSESTAHDPGTTSASQRLVGRAPARTTCRSLYIPVTAAPLSRNLASADAALVRAFPRRSSMLTRWHRPRLLCVCAGILQDHQLVAAWRSQSPLWSLPPHGCTDGPPFRCRHQPGAAAVAAAAARAAESVASAAVVHGCSGGSGGGAVTSVVVAEAGGRL